MQLLHNGDGICLCGDVILCCEKTKDINYISVIYLNHLLYPQLISLA